MSAVPPLPGVKRKGIPLRIRFRNENNGGLSVVDSSGDKIGKVLDVSERIEFLLDVDIAVDGRRLRRGTAKVVL